MLNIKMSKAEEFRVNSFTLGMTSCQLKCDMAAERPIYLYVSPSKTAVYYSESLTTLLKDWRVDKPLQVSTSGLNFLLQSGVIPPPYSAIENLYVIGIGQIAELTSGEGQIVVTFKEDFPFYREQKVAQRTVKPDHEKIIQLLAKATSQRLSQNKQTYLFHSAGKDSNSIALSLTALGMQTDTTFITYKARGQNDESDISKGIAHKLGFKHHILDIDRVAEQLRYDDLVDYQSKSPLPCLDNAALSYVLFGQALDFSGSNIIDGMGNDIYIGHIPLRKELHRQLVFKNLRPLKQAIKIVNKLSSHSVFYKSRAECTGLKGLSPGDAAEILEDAEDLGDYWLGFSDRFADLHFVDFRARVRGEIIDQEMFMRKVRNFADVYGANLIFPWANEQVANYFLTLPNEELYDSDNLTNKLVLRCLIKDKLGLDSDALGKKSFKFQFWSLLQKFWVEVKQEITSCHLWDPSAIEILLMQLVNQATANNRSSQHARVLVHRLYLISAWVNHSSFLKDTTVRNDT